MKVDIDSSTIKGKKWAYITYYNIFSLFKQGEYITLDKMFDFIGEDRSVIYITRSVNHLEHFDRIYYFDNGKIVESGSWKELIKKKGKFYKETQNKGE